MTKQGTIRQGKSPHIKDGQDNPIEGKEFQKQPKEPEIHLLPLLEVLQNHQANSCNMYTEDLVQTLVGSVFATAVSVSPCEPCLVDTVAISPGGLHPL